MEKLRIKYDFSHGPIWKDKYDVETGKWSTGIDVIDKDKALNVLNDEAEKEYSSLYSFNKDGVLIFDWQTFEDKKSDLLSLIQTIILRLNSINDGSFEIVDEETPMLREMSILAQGIELESLEQRKIKYASDVRSELKRRGIAAEDIDKVIGKTGFVSTLEKYPEEQMHYSVSDAVNEILLIAGEGDNNIYD